MLSLFVGVVTTAMESAAQNQRSEKQKAAYMQQLLKNYPKCTEQRLREYRKIFTTFDADGGGFLDKDEFSMLLKCIEPE
eukprot:625913-Prymnesium_polylepis.1